ncbi:MAG: NAD(P)/FAD-dependent oxidoreductase [Candidatus Methanoperedens sp.]|uniref:NAD(P)/FAD-dependent oxidoreductase n=1 Tax=Candidatus Methanoperedens sp. BLZ2 TaxID=2035255 RepID=UPI000BE3AB91|nr:NAD(P)/FAD-dependent oxidoreductase [Candidatus Methanoperedens sp. BLZ2]KAB2942144.1 MAG: NAD(P)/FAD-dependent oxidoreductase [Candidatus Methanoperedens sp.]MBZ0177183.1 NAD(P)/FAD-dependent oxidoreductase [Candidatus Methanoperedens nitroreducens]MCX9078855.1 NAD(P)/FAD-dependent oxidoreductase [Candidatus Methanoperedens sp.]
MIKKDVIIIGAGASGMMCAIESGKRGRTVLVLDHAEKIGKKIRISGGGKCNFTNINIHSTNFISNNPHFCKSALSRFSPRDFIALLEKHGIKYEEREAGQLFCTGSSEEIIRMLEKESNDTAVEIILNCHIKEIKKEDSFIVSTDNGIFQSGSLVIATGALSYPQIGASGMGHNIAKQFGLKVTELKTALVPFIFSRKDMTIFSELSGISIDGAIKCNKMEFRGSILFTHRGLSGPAILQISSYWKESETIVIDLLPGIDIFGIFIERQLNKSKIDMHNLLSEFLPSRLAKIWCASNIKSKPVNQYNEKELKTIAHQIHNWEIKPNTTEDFKTAEATLGGIDTDELSSKTMESKKFKGLYFTGEVIDVTGQLGGYNLHWAWASGFVAGQYA